MIQIDGLEVYRYEVRCKVNALDLSSEQLIELGMDEGDYSDMSRMLEAGGDFVVSWDYDVPCVHLVNFAVTNGNAFVDLTSLQVNYDMIEHLIELEDDGTWARDKADFAADAMFEDV